MSVGKKAQPSTLSDEAQEIFNAVEAQKVEAMAEYNQGVESNNPTKVKNETLASDASPEDLLSGFEVKREYVEKLGKEEFLYPNLIISGHILVIIALSGAGKTTFLYRVVVPHLVKHGKKVFYIDADSPASDHKWMLDFADDVGFKFINPDVNLGESIDSFFKSLNEMTKAQVDMSNRVFFFDTLKKFTNLMCKQSVKEFFGLCRRLTHCGATVVLPAHANKFRDKEGCLVFEGVGDVKSDTDELIFFEREKKNDGGIDITTVVDTDKGAKVRGIFEPFSFHITPERDVQLYDKPLEIVDHTATKDLMATDDEILITVEEYLREVGEPVNKKLLVEHVNDMMDGAGQKRIRKLIAQNSEMKKGTEAKRRFVYTIGPHNSHLYELPMQMKQTGIANEF